MCTLKGACQYTLFDVRGVEIHSIHTIQCMCEMLYKRSKQCMYVEDVKDGVEQNVSVCSFPIFDIFDIHSITALRCILSIFDML